jgi:septum formation protein
MNMILASTSIYRKNLLASTGLSFQSVSPLLDEESEKARLISDRLTPLQMAQKLAFLKGSSLLSAHPAATIISADQIVSLNGHILGKTQNLNQALEQLLQLNYKTHELITSVCLWHEGLVYQHTDISRLTMKELTRQELANYIQLDQTMDCAGSYKIESRGLALFASIQCEDFSAIQGLPMIWLTNKLKELGYEFFKS